MIAILVAIAVFIADRLTKTWAVSHLVLGASVPVLPLLDWTLVENRGAAFGILSGATAALILVALGAIIGLIVLLRRRPSVWVQLGVGGVLGGALGNLYDRVLHLSVVDFIDVRVWPYVFNVADIGITLGAIVLVVALWREN